ncbi:hypothetical protein BGZ83_001554 [Gryganskiella cystojenkinii]|nr:hypothetical protein BGZ83_001554 [Gryganskiella cystojenkinii]
MNTAQRNQLARPYGSVAPHSSQSPRLQVIGEGHQSSNSDAPQPVGGAGAGAGAGAPGPGVEVVNPDLVPIIAEGNIFLNEVGGAANAEADEDNGQ